MDHALDLISLRSVEHYADTSCLLIGGSIRVDAPLWDFFCPMAFHEGEFGDEVGHYLSLYSCAWTILYIEFI